MAENLREILGQGNYVDGFSDGVARKCTPVKMRVLADFLDKISAVNLTKLWVNCLFPESEKILEEVLGIVFPDYPIDEIIDNIDSVNFPKIMETVLTINGINIPTEGEEKNEMGV